MGGHTVMGGLGAQPRVGHGRPRSILAMATVKRQMPPFGPRLVVKTCGATVPEYSSPSLLQACYPINQNCSDPAQHLLLNPALL